ncbi:hypothetical protein TNCV_3534271 [Trichonephila clavipes]|nr:hypothetical protein TNCV_3534271 [Trichonephila clavipes]
MPNERYIPERDVQSISLSSKLRQWKLLLQKRYEHLQSLSDEVETYPASEKLDEIMDITPDRESEFQNEHDTIELKKKIKCYLKTFIKKVTKPRAFHTSHTVPCQKDTRKKKCNMQFVDHQRTIKLQ